MYSLIVDTYYSGFLNAFLSEHPEAKRHAYADLWRLIMEQHFGTADAYSANLQKVGHKGVEVVANCEFLQRAWAKEHHAKLGMTYPLYRSVKSTKKWLINVLEEQVKQMKPDILYVQDMNWTNGSFLRTVKPRVSLIVGQIACALRSNVDLEPYDLVITSFPHFVGYFQERGIRAEYLPLAFDERVLSSVSKQYASYNVTFVGGFSPQHHWGTEVFEHLARHVEVEFWGYGTEMLPKESIIRQICHGELWGKDMYSVLSRSRVTLNRHIDLAGSCANNMRLYEATGVGACLVTDLKDNLHVMFDLDKEVVPYTCGEDCVEKVNYLLEHDEERKEIAKAGQQRTLREHTYLQRMNELAEVLQKHLSISGRSRGR
jgi:spore maturation protein CgeB